MKRIILISIAILISGIIFADTLLDDKRITSNGLYIEPIAKMGGTYQLTGAQSLWTFNHAFSIGIGGFQSNEFQLDSSSYRNNTANADLTYKASFYAITTEYTFFPDLLFHFNVGFNIGAGTLERTADNVANYTNLTSESESAGITFYELLVSGEMNIHANFRLAVGFSMLNAQHSMDDISGLGSSHETPDLNQILFSLGLKMGTF
jgi:hypothetical protein